MSGNEELTEKMTIVNVRGMHARAAQVLVRAVLPFKSEVYLHFNDEHANAKSIMGLLTLCAPLWSRITVSCKGSDAHETMDAVRTLIANRFNEEE